MNKVFALNFFLFVAPMCASESLPFSSTEFDQYCAMRTIANVVTNVVNTINNDPKSIISLHYWGNQGEANKVNPRYDRTKQGLFLEFYEDIPLSIRTPWGKWGLNGHRNLIWKDRKSNPTIPQQMNVAQKMILSKLSKNIELEFDATLTSHNQHAPVFKIKSVCGHNLPEAIQTQESFWILTEDKKITCFDGDTMDKKWAAMTKQYQEQILHR